MYKYPKFEVEIEREVAAGQLSWPAPGAAADDKNLGCNRDYYDLRRLPWSEAESVFRVEGELIARIEAAEDPDEEYEAIEEEGTEEPDGIYGLDIGVASTAIALSAAGCVPFSSCSAGAFGGHHHECHPVVAFYARSETVDILLECAQEANIGLVNYDTGELIAYADDIRHMRDFAQALMGRRAALRAQRRLRRTKPEREESDEAKQLKLL